ncbi:MAG: AmmeMemoRadiSam system protein B [Candidatus Rokubacteria bacterium]|nr:AmmeMemoRadiSam system protein B [Candidatus Rokubacteria bacterium]
MEGSRKPAVAGLFYPDRPEQMEADLAGLLEDVQPKVAPRALVVPHAGWIYSGKVAGAVYSRVELPRLAVLLGPNHTGLGGWGSIVTRGRWAIPGGEIPIAADLGRQILAGCRELQEDESAHAREHALEVQLPFLRRLRPDIQFVPVALMKTDLPFCEAVGRAVAAAVVASAEPVLLISSTDLNHYESQTVSNRKDRLAIDAILALDPERLQRTVRDHHISMCGIAPTTALLSAVRNLGARRAELVRYMTSGDVSGDYDRVVGYCGVIIQ